MKKEIYTYDKDNEVLTINEGVEHLSQVFSNNKIKEIYIPESVEEIGKKAFYKNPIEELSFANDSRLANVEDSEHMNIEYSRLRSIGERAFEYNNIEGVVYIPEFVEEIGESAFYSGKMVYIPEIDYDNDICCSIEEEVPHLVFPTAFYSFRQNLIKELLHLKRRILEIENQKQLKSTQEEIKRKLIIK